MTYTQNRQGAWFIVSLGEMWFALLVIICSFSNQAFYIFTFFNSPSVSGICWHFWPRHQREAQRLRPPRYEAPHRPGLQQGTTRWQLLPVWDSNCNCVCKSVNCCKQYDRFKWLGDINAASWKLNSARTNYFPAWFCFRSSQVYSMNGTCCRPGWGRAAVSGGWACPPPAPGQSAGRWRGWWWTPSPAWRGTWPGGTTVSPRWQKRSSSSSLMWVMQGNCIHIEMLSITIFHKHICLDVFGCAHIKCIPGPNLLCFAWKSNILLSLKCEQH